MKRTWSRFNQCLRFCKSNDDRVRAGALANKLLKTDDISFWKDVSKMNRINSNVLASTISGISGECNITKMWHEHYSDLLNSNGDTKYMSYVNCVTKCIDNTSESFPKLSVSEIRGTIAKISNLTKVLVQTLCKVNTLNMLILDYYVYSVWFLMQCFPMDIYHLS